MGGFTDQQVSQWREHGWVLIPGLVPAEEIDAALDDLWEIYPRPEEFHQGNGGQRRASFLGGEDERGLFGSNKPPADGLAFRSEQFLGRALFPFGGSNRLNRLMVHPNLVGFAQAALGSDDLRIYQMALWAKYTGVTNYDQPLHQDHNHSVVPPRMEPGWWFMEGFLYLSDVGEAQAPTRAVSVTDSEGDIEVGVRSPEKYPELYASEKAAIGPRGSYLAYRPDVWHRGVNLTSPRGARFLLGLSFKLGQQDWVGYENVQSRSTSKRFIRFVESCSPSELALFGVPLPGHEYWNRSTVDAMAQRYPRLDMAPWRDAL